MIQTLRENPEIYLLIAAGVLFVFGALFYLLFGRSLRREVVANRRMEMLSKGISPHEVLLQLRRERETTRRNLPFITPLKDAMQKAAMRTPIQRVGLIMLVVGLVVFFILRRLLDGTNPLLLGLLALYLGYWLVLFWIKGKAKKRMAEFEEQLPDAIDLIVRSLRVGNPFVTSIGTVAREMSDPIGTEFGMISDEVSFGLELNDALDRAMDRVDLQDFRFLAVAIGIQSQSGGNLAEILEGLAAVIRSRFRMFRKIRAITAEGRGAGWFLSVFPIVALFGVKLVKPDYYERVSDDPMFMPGVYLTFILLVINIVFVRMIVKIKV